MQSEVADPRRATEDAYLEITFRNARKSERTPGKSAAGRSREKEDTGRLYAFLVNLVDAGRPLEIAG